MGAKESHLQASYPEIEILSGPSNLKTIQSPCSRTNVSSNFQTDTILDENWDSSMRTIKRKANATKFQETEIKKNLENGAHTSSAGDNITETGFPRQINSIYLASHKTDSKKSEEKGPKHMFSPDFSVTHEDAGDIDLSSSESLISAETVLNRFRARSKQITSVQSKSSITNAPVTTILTLSTSPSQTHFATTDMKSTVRDICNRKTEESTKDKRIISSATNKDECITESLKQESNVGSEDHQHFESCSVGCSDILVKSNEVSPQVSPALGFQTSACGDVIFTAYLRISGDNTSGWKTFVKRSERSLKGLQRQFDCKIQMHEKPFNFRAICVHKLRIEGTTHRDVLRCKNALPNYFTKFMITSHERSDESFNRRQRRC